MQLGIEKDKNLIYEGSGDWGQPLWPSPIVIPAAFASTEDKELKPADGKLAHKSYIFREVDYDPVSRVRRGILYHADSNTRPCEWHVSPHPAIERDKHDVTTQGILKKRLYSFGSFSLHVTLRDIDRGQPLILLGVGDSYTIWSILSVEKLASDDEMVILKARQSFGALPNVNYKKVPEVGRDNVKAALNALQEDIYRAGAESVVDRSREAMTAILSAYCQDAGIAGNGKDTGELVRTLRNLKENKKEVVANLADTVRIFHSRGKNAPRERMSLRSLTEQDAELAIQSVGVVLCELEWGSW